MQQYTVETLMRYAKKLSGQTNASNQDVIDALNFGVDHISVIKQMTGSKTNPDSSNHEDVARTSVTTSDTKLNIQGGDLANGEVSTFRHVEIQLGDQFRRLIPIDSRDSHYEYLQNQSGTPEYFDLEGQIIRLLPTPNGSYTYRLIYGRVHPRFSVDNLTQATGLLPNEEEYAALYAADRLMIGSNDPSRTQIRNEMTVKQREIEKMVALRDQSASKRLKPKNSTIGRNGFNRTYKTTI